MGLTAFLSEPGGLLSVNRHRRTLLFALPAVFAAALLFVGTFSASAAPPPRPTPPAPPFSGISLPNPPEPGAKRNAPETNLKEFPKRADTGQRKPAAPGPVTEEVISEQSLAGGIKQVTIYTPAPNVTPADLLARVQKSGDQSARVVQEGGAPSGQVQAAPSDCAFGTARTIRCPVAFWANNGYDDPQVRFNDHTGANWPVDQSVYTWNQAVGIDSYYKYNACPFQAGARCVDLFSGNYGATGWAGLTTYQIDANSRFVENGTYIQFNDYYTYNADGFRQDTCHEIGHALGLAHNVQDFSCLWYQIKNNAHRVPDSDDFNMLASLYSVPR